jgi:L-aminopeptidase/D-esterase-like protein
MWLASAVGSLNVARLGGVSLQPVVNGQVSSTEAPVEAGSLWAGTGAVIFTVRRAG